MSETLTATYARRRYTSPDGFMSIGVVTLANGTELAVVGPAEPFLAVGTTYRFTGKKETHEKHGEQFRYLVAVAVISLDRDGVVAYLMRLEGIGEARAEKLWTLYGAKTIEEVRERPASVVQSAGIPAEVIFRASRVLTSERSREAVTLELYSLLARRGFQMQRVVEEAIELWGSRAAETVRANPYALLLSDVTSCSWARVDKLYLDLGGAKDSLERQSLAAVAYMQGEGGHTWFPVANVSRAVRAMCGHGTGKGLGVDLAIRTGLLVAWGEDAGRVVALAKEATAEADLAERLRVLTQPLVEMKAKTYASKLITVPLALLEDSLVPPLF